MVFSSSPDRYKHHTNRYLDKLKQDPEDKTALDMLDYYESEKMRILTLENSEEWKKNNLEYDLRSTEWILEKVRKNSVYAQHLYAAMCNTEFMKNEIWPVLKGETWSCSWRHAGGIISDMIGRGDYMDWYCSGIRGANEQDSDYVGEGIVTEEIKNDLFALGWKVIEYQDN